MSQYSKYPPEGGVPTYADSTYFPLNLIDGSLALARDTDTLYVWNEPTMSWLAIATPGAAIAINGLLSDVTATGPGVVVATIQPNVVTNAKLADMDANTIKGNNTGGATDPADLTVAQVKTMLDLAGSNSGDVTLTAVGSSPNANAASLSGQALTLQPADASNPGVVTADTQTIAGAKTFSSALTASGTVLIGTTTNTDNSQLTLKNLGGDTQTALQIVSETNVKTGISGIGNFFYFSTGAIPFFSYNADDTRMALGYNAGAPRFRLSMDSNSASTTPADIVSGSTTVFPPVLILRQQNSTASNYGGIANCGSSNIINGWAVWYNDTQTSSSEDSHFAIATANAGTRAEKLTISKTGQVAIQIAGTGLSIKEGSNCKQGTVSLVAGTAVVTNSSVTANSRIFLTSQADGGTPGFLRITAIVASTSFTILSSNALDTSTVAYFITEPS